MGRRDGEPRDLLSISSVCLLPLSVKDALILSRAAFALAGATDALTQRVTV